MPKPYFFYLLQDMTKYIAWAGKVIMGDNSLSPFSVNHCGRLERGFLKVADDGIAHREK